LVVAAARGAIASLRPPAPQARPLSHAQKILHFAIGFVGWFIVNGAIWAWQGLEVYGPSYWSPLIRGTLAGNSGLLWFLLLPTNIGALFLLALIRRWIAFGVLTALAVNLVITLILSMFLNALCGIPFFITPTRLQ
jgi:hypothetical protein